MASLLEFFADPLGRWVHTLAFCCCALASGVMLARARPTRRGSLFWIAVLGLAICAPILVFQVATLIYDAFVRGEELRIASVFLGGSMSDIWWPPKELELAELIRQVFNLPPYQGGPSIFFSWMVWHLPVATCAWAIWGRPGGIIDKFFGVAILLLAGLTALTGIATAILMVQTASYDSQQGVFDPQDVVIDYAYIPELSWLVFYAIVILWFVALGSLLFRRPSKS